MPGGTGSTTVMRMICPRELVHKHMLARILPFRSAMHGVSNTPQLRLFQGLQRNRHSQQGVAILLVLLIFLATASSLVLSALSTSRQDIEAQSQRELAYQMQLAKANLLAYAANSHLFHNDGRGPGFLPCPDNDALDEAAPASCTGIAQLGRLPQFAEAGGGRMPFNDFYAGTDQQFWYTAGPRYVYENDPVSEFHKARYRTSTTWAEASDYRLSLDGVTGYVAFIIAPGEASSSQNRSGGSEDYANYLDGQNGGDGYNFHSSYAANPAQFNDQILGITLDEYMHYVGPEVTRAIKLVLDQQHDLDGFYDAYDPLDFRDFFDTRQAWLIQDASIAPSNNELWSTYTVYEKLSDDSFRIYFSGCANMWFVATYGSTSISRDGDSC